MEPLFSVTLDDDELTTARTLARLVYGGNKRRWEIPPPRADDLAFAGLVAFAVYLARETLITFSGPLPYLGPGRTRPGSHQPDGFVMWIGGEECKVGIRGVSGTTFTVPVWQLDLLPDFLIAVSLEGATVAFWGAVTRQGLIDRAAAFPTIPAARRGQTAYKRLPLDVFNPATLRQLLGDADKQHGS